MIKEITEKDIAECVGVIVKSFSTVADEFGFTAENAPRATPHKDCAHIAPSYL